MRFEPGKGFFCRNLSIRDITDLYQLRIALELQGVKLAVKHASDGDIDELASFLSRTSSHSGRSLEEVLSFDEYFHETIAGLSGNGELSKILKMVNARIRFFRWVDMEARRPETQTEHGEILSALRARDVDNACRLMENHITRRSDQIAEAVKECHARLFVVEDLSREFPAISAMQAPGHSRFTTRSSKALLPTG